jgi:hypothetical protein
MTVSNEPAELLTKLEDLGLESFTPCLGSRFSAVCDGAAAMTLELIEATDSGSSDVHERFSLVFRSTAPGEMQGTWRLSNAKLGTFDLFMVAIGSAGEGFLYEAVFSRMHVSSAGVQ